MKAKSFQRICLMAACFSFVDASAAAPI